MFHAATDRPKKRLFPVSRSLWPTATKRANRREIAAAEPLIPLLAQAVDRVGRFADTAELASTSLKSILKNFRRYTLMNPISRSTIDDDELLLNQAPLATSYDDIPYPRLAFPYTHPSHLATIGRLLGLLPAPVDRCRVLELGCASGANLLPIAYALPGSTLVGIDLSERQIAEGRKMADDLGLTNVVLDEMDIRQAAESLFERFGLFDYIIAHGIYSWVPDEVKDAVLSASRRLLAPEGIAYVSYNCYPGCQQREMIRRMCQYHGRRDRDPRAFVAANRAFLESLIDMLPAADDPYRAVLREQAISLLGERDAVILHDDLERDNDPQLLHQFVTHAARHGLQYLGDAHFGQMFGIGIDAAGLELIRQGADVLDFQQYLDFLYGRSLRTTLLCRDEVTVRHHLVPEAARDLWISSSAEPTTQDGQRLSRADIDQIDVNDAAPIVFRADECTTSLASRTSKAAMLELAAASPKSLTFEAFVDRVRARLEASGRREAMANNSQESIRSDPLEQELAAAAVEWFGMRLIELRAFDPPMATEPSERPIASAVARYQIAKGWATVDPARLEGERSAKQTVASGAMPTALRGHAPEGKSKSTASSINQVTNLLHRRINLDGELATKVLMHLDGQHDRAQIVESLIQPVLSGEAEIRVEGRSLRNPTAVRKALDDRVAAVIADFARNALLVREVAPS
jgi:SAM-dependent methyltransferase